MFADVLCEEVGEGGAAPERTPEERREEGAEPETSECLPASLSMEERPSAEGITTTEQVPSAPDEGNGERVTPAAGEGVVQEPSGDAPAGVASSSGDTPARETDVLRMRAEPQAISGDAPAVPGDSAEPPATMAAEEGEPEGEPDGRDPTDISGAPPAIEEAVPQAEAASIAQIVHVHLDSDSSSTTEVAPMEEVSEAPSGD